MRNLIIMTFLLPAIGGLGTVIQPVRKATECPSQSFSRAGERIGDRGIKPIRDLKLLGRDIGRCF